MVWIYFHVSSLFSALDVPTSPEIESVEPFSSTAVVNFREPESMGGVPVIKYRVEWRLPGQEWTGKEFDTDGCESYIYIYSI